MKPAITSIRPYEYPQVVDVWEAAVRATHHFLKEEDIAYFKPLILKEYLAAVDLKAVRVEGGSISGFLGVAGDSIEMLFIHPQFHRKGLGTQLLQYAISELGATKVDVNEDNPEAQGFYEYHGFAVTSRSPLDGLGKPYPILHMELQNNKGRKIEDTMNFNVQNLIDAIEEARKGFIDAIKTLSDEQVRFKSSQDEWSILEITEHMVWAEQIGVCGMFKAIEGLKKNQPIWSGDSPNEGLSVEQIVKNTWQAKETVPEVAEPKWGGSIMFWISSLKNCRHLLLDLVDESESVNLHHAIYPHPISGPMDVVQRLAFLRFHLERHTEQINRVKAHDQYPT